MDGDPLKRLKVFFWATAFLLGAIPTVGNIFALFYSTPLGFQRLGSLWIAITLLVLGCSRYAVTEMNKAVHGRGPEKAKALEKLGPVIYSEDKGWQNFMSKDGIEYETPLKTWEELQVLTTDLEDYVSYRLQPTEISVGVAATLQWGYGDLIFCLLHGKGFSLC